MALVDPGERLFLISKIEKIEDRLQEDLECQ